MLLMIFLGSVVAAVVVVAYSYQVLLGSWGRAKRVMYAPPPLPPPPPNVSAMLAAVTLPSLPAAPVKVPMGTAPQPTIGSSLPERFIPPLAAHAGPPSPPPRRQPKGSTPPPPPRTRERAVVIDDFVEDQTSVELTAHRHS